MLLDVLEVSWGTADIPAFGLGVDVKVQATNGPIYEYNTLHASTFHVKCSLQ